MVKQEGGFKKTYGFSKEAGEARKKALQEKAETGYVADRGRAAGLSLESTEELKARAEELEAEAKAKFDAEEEKAYAEADAEMSAETIKLLTEKRNEALARGDNEMVDRLDASIEKLGGTPKEPPAEQKKAA